MVGGDAVNVATGGVADTFAVAFAEDFALGLLAVAGLALVARVAGGGSGSEGEGEGGVSSTSVGGSGLVSGATRAVDVVSGLGADADACGTAARDVNTMISAAAIDAPRPPATAMSFGLRSAEDVETVSVTRTGAREGRSEPPRSVCGTTVVAARAFATRSAERGVIGGAVGTPEPMSSVRMTCGFDDRSESVIPPDRVDVKATSASRSSATVA